METPKDENPEVLFSVFDTVTGLLSSYGWHILFFAVTANLIWTSVRPSLQRWQNRRREQEQQTEYDQNPERLITLQEGLERSRRRLQEELDQKAREHAEKLKKFEEDKRQEKIKKWECVQTGRSAKTLEEDAAATDSSKKLDVDKSTRLRGHDYNPLTGSSGSCGYRPSRSSGNRGGG